MIPPRTSLPSTSGLKSIIPTCFMSRRIIPTPYDNDTPLESNYLAAKVLTFSVEDSWLSRSSGSQRDKKAPLPSHRLGTPPTIDVRRNMPACRSFPYAPARNSFPDSGLDYPQPCGTPRHASYGPRPRTRYVGPTFSC
jgi:hypothetical protein